MSRIPEITHRHKIAIICEGNEDYAYIKKLTEIDVWSSIYDFKLINAHSASNISARYEDAFQNDMYEAVLIFCDTDKPPYREYSLLKKKIQDFHGGRYGVIGKVIIFANPCTMQIILSHFGDVLLKNQGKKTNASVIEKLTGIKEYDAHDKQINELCSKIFKRTYAEMKLRIKDMDGPDTIAGNTNFIHFLDKFEGIDTKWIQILNNYLMKD